MGTEYNITTTPSKVNQSVGHSDWWVGNTGSETVFLRFFQVRHDDVSGFAGSEAELTVLCEAQLAAGATNFIGANIAMLAVVCGTGKSSTIEIGAGSGYAVDGESLEITDGKIGQKAAGTTNDHLAGGITPAKLAASILSGIRRNVSIINHAANPDYQVQLIGASNVIVGSDDGTVAMTVASALTCDITQSGAGGLDTGAEAASTLYYLWLFQKSSDSTQSLVASTSSTSPTAPADYDIKALVGTVRNDADSNFLTPQSEVGGDDPEVDLAAIIRAINLADHLPNLVITAGDEDGANKRTFTVQVKDARGNNLTDKHLIRVWISTADYGPASAAGNTYAHEAGTAHRPIEANAEYLITTDASGKVEFGVTVAGAATRYIMGMIGGREYSSGQVDWAA